MIDAAEVLGRRRRYWENGYRPLEIWNPDQIVNDAGEKLKSPGKQPRGRWRELAGRNPPTATEQPPHPRALNTGILCGEVIGVDVDILDQPLADQVVHLVERTVGSTPLVRIGRAPKILLVYRAAAVFSKVQTAELLLLGGTIIKVEALAQGQQFVADGTHPQTGEPYYWLDGSPETVRIDELPVVTEQQVREIITAAETLLRQAGAVPKPKPNAQNNQQHPQNRGGFFEQVNQAALADLAAWVRGLLPKARFQPGTGAWRIPSADLGRDLEEDVSIAPGGIWDFGLEEPRTAIDLAIEHHAASTPVEAALWLCDRLRIDPVSLGWTGHARHQTAAAVSAQPVDIDLEEWDLGAAKINPAELPARGWLLGNWHCRQFISSLLGDGAVGKTAVRIACALSLATGRSDILGEHVFERARVLFCCFEDGTTELKRRFAAAMLHHRITDADIEGWLFVSALSRADLKLAVGHNGDTKPGPLIDALDRSITRREVDILYLDPFIKTHALNENDNHAMDLVAEILARIAIRHNIAIDTPHHVRKGPADPGNADRGRGASSFKDGIRLGQTASPMSAEEAKLFSIDDGERRRLVRIDDAKINLAPPASEAKWFRLVGVPLGNRTVLYPSGDNIATVVRWRPPDFWKDLTDPVANRILDVIAAGDDGRLYSNHGQADDRAAWRVVSRNLPGLTEVQSREVIATWLRNGVLYHDKYYDKADRRERRGLLVSDDKRPGPRR